MKNARPAIHETSADLTIGILSPAAGFSKFFGTENPRHMRVILALLKRSMRREDVDRIAGCSNGPDLVSELRHRGLEIPCTRIDAFDRDGRPCRPGVYSLTSTDRRKVYGWFKQRGGKNDQ